VEFVPRSEESTSTDSAQVSTASSASAELLTDYYWYLNIQCWEVFSFEADGTINIYYTDMGLDVPSENTVLTTDELTAAFPEDRTYTFDGQTLVMSMSGYDITLDLYDKQTNPANFVDIGAAQDVEEYDGTIYFYETDWSPSPELDSDNATYLVRLGKKA
jgi:hypothetical protein